MAQTDEIIVRFSAEGGDTVEEAFRRVGAGADRATGSTTRASASLDGLRLKSDERVARNLGAIAQEFARGGSAADVMAVAVSRLGESFKGAFVVAAAGAVGVGLYESITRTGEAMIRLNSEVAALTSRRGTADFLGTDAINKNLSDITAKIKEIYAQQVTRSNSLLSSLLGTGGAAPTAGIIPKLNAEDEKKRDALKRAAAGALDDLGTKAENLNKIERERLKGSELQAAMDLAEIEHKEKLGVIAASAAAAGIQGKTKAEREENKRFELEKEALQKQGDLTQIQLDLEKELANVHGQFLSQEKESLAVAEAKVKALERQQRAGPHNDRDRERLNTAKEGAIGDETRALINKSARPFGNLSQDILEYQLAKKQREWEASKIAAGDDTPDRQRHVAELDRFMLQKQIDFEKGTRENIINNTPQGKAFERQSDAHIKALEERRNAIDKDLGLADKSEGSDFSGIKSLAGLDFEGLRALDNLSLTIK